MALDQQQLGGLMLAMLSKLEEHYGEGLENVELEDAFLVVAIQETRGESGHTGYHWMSTCDTYHAQVGMLTVGLDSLKASVHGSDI